VSTLNFRFTTERAIGLSLFLFAFLVFWLSPVKQVTDSGYSMLLSQSLIEHQTFALDVYPLPRLEPVDRGYYTSDGPLHQLELINSHIYYHFPPGGPILSVPYVAVANAFGQRVTEPDGTYNERNEIRVEAALASLLMAVLTVVFFLTARLVLPVAWSLVIAVGASFGTQVWSTASRAMWTDTWGILLLAIAIFLLIAREAGKRRINSVLFGTLMAWVYFVRPTNAVHIIAISVYLALYYRRLIIGYVLTGLAWLGLFVAYSWYYFHQALPSYYRASRIYFGVFWQALAGNLISPSRGLLVYVPVLFFVGYLLVRHCYHLAHRRLLVLALAAIVLHVLLVSSFGHWWGGFSYGPRFMTGLVPWFVLLGIVGVEAALKARGQSSVAGSRTGWRVEMASGALILCLSIAINARGAISWATWQWNAQPLHIDRHPERLWDWRQPQFLAGLINPPPPAQYPQASAGRVEFVGSETEQFLWYGWSAPGPDYVWSDGREAALVFAIEPVQNLALTLRVAGFVVPPKHDQQRVQLSLNGSPVGSFVLTDANPHEYKIGLPSALLGRKNVLTFALPDAVAPKRLGVNPDARDLGIALYWIEFGSGQPLR
jgi:hypothetical protein